MFLAFTMDSYLKQSQMSVRSGHYFAIFGGLNVLGNLVQRLKSYEGS